MRDRMTKLGYTTEYKIETMARAYGRDLPLAWKKSVELARQLRGKTVERAREYLEGVVALKQPVPMRTYRRWIAHKAGTGPARYPVNAAKAFLKILESAVANAEFTGKEDPDTMVIRVINAHKGATTKGYRPRAYGRSSPWNQDSVNLEIVLEEVV
ncbi:MAG: 50S ribosomal protein L22 [Methanobacteriota archaeon]|nr:MAG: 50S ribosomal protein L22 [Euryarchaeota archaeon]